jgi:hypothetical protein
MKLVPGRIHPQAVGAYGEKVVEAELVAERLDSEQRQCQRKKCCGV